MATHTFNGTYTNPDGTFPSSGAVTYELLSPYLVADGRQVSMDAQSVAIDDSNGNWSATIAVPDDAAEAVRYLFTFPDGTVVKILVSQNSSSDWETALLSVVDAAVYAPSVFEDYLLKSGARAGAVTAAQALTLGWVVADEISADMTIPSGYHAIRTDTSIADGVTVTVAGTMVIL